MKSSTSYYVAVGVGLALCLALTVARVLEINAGHSPTMALTAAFSAAVTALLGLIAFGRSGGG